jgi:ABC-type lipoprotein release transport system permease subunit
MARNLAVGFVGVVGAVGIATALSPTAPLGEARIAEASTGIAFDPLVLPLGALIGVVLVIALGLWPALWAARTLRTDERGADAGPSILVERLAAAGAPPTAVIGVRNAVERRSGGGAVPVGSALLGTVLAVVALCGTAVFGASLSHLTTTPRLYGHPEQLDFNYNAAPSPALVKTLEHDRAITGITELVAVELSVNKVNVGGIAGTTIRGPLLLSSADGHLPDGPGQIALGATTMRQAGAQLGSVVNVTVSMPSGGKRTTPFRVVSQVSFPVLSGVVSLGTGAALTSAAYAAAACPAGADEAACQRAVHTDAEGGSGMSASVVSGAPGQTAIMHYLDAYEGVAALPVIPTSLINFGQAVNFPLIFGAILAVFGAATLAHLLIVSVSRRRREMGLLKVLGFVNAQVVSAVAWQASTLAIVGIAIGVPLGVVVGQTVWRTFANNLGVVPIAVVPVWLVAVLAAGVVLVANLIALGPALVATRSTSADLLRTA